MTAKTPNEKIGQYAGKDPSIYLRMGDIAREIGALERAVLYYRLASESFVRLRLHNLP